MFGKIYPKLRFGLLFTVKKFILKNTFKEKTKGVELGYATEKSHMFAFGRLDDRSNAAAGGSFGSL